MPTSVWRQQQVGEDLDQHWVEEVYLAASTHTPPPAKASTKADRVRQALRELEFVADDVSHTISSKSNFDFGRITGAVEDLMYALGSRNSYKIRIPFDVEWVDDKVTKGTEDEGKESDK